MPNTPHHHCTIGPMHAQPSTPSLYYRSHACPTLHTITILQVPCMPNRASMLMWPWYCHIVTSISCLVTALMHDHANCLRVAYHVWSQRSCMVMPTTCVWHIMNDHSAHAWSCQLLAYGISCLVTALMHDHSNSFLVAYHVWSQRSCMIMPTACEWHIMSGHRAHAWSCQLLACGISCLITAFTHDHANCLRMTYHVWSPLSCMIMPTTCVWHVMSDHCMIMWPAWVALHG